MSDARPTIGISMGDPGGIGAEVVVKALADPELRKLARYVIFGLNELMAYAADLAEIEPYWWRDQHERFSQNDVQNLQHLASAGLNPATLGLPNLTQEVALGQGTCGALDRASLNDVNAGIKRHWPNLNNSQVNVLVRSSVAAYCQYNSGKLS